LRGNKPALGHNVLAQASNLHLEGLMPVLREIIDVITMKSDRPVRRLVAYYAIVAVVVAILSFFFKDEMLRIAAKGLGEAPDGPTILTDALSSSPTSSVSFGPGSLLDVAVTTTLILIGALVLILPVTWVYMSARPSGGQHNQNVVQTLIILPMVVAGIVFIVQNSLALAFSLAGVVGAVRFRTTLRDSRDLVYIFLSIVIGFAAGVQSLAVGAVISIVFNFVLIITWHYDYGRNMLMPTASAQWSRPLQALASPTGDHQIPDRDLVLSLTPQNAAALADRFKRVQKTVGSKKKKPRFDTILTVTTDNVSEAQKQVEEVLDRMTKRWDLDEVVTNVGKPSEIYYLARLKKSMPRDVLLTAIHENADGVIATADLEVAEPVEDKDS
jgi:flagellar hook-basal body complex protein FliE